MIHSLSTEGALPRARQGYSKFLYNKWFLLLLLFGFAAGCKKVVEEAGIINPCPVVVSTDPADKAVDVALNKLISVTFNTDMNPSTINAVSFTIRQGTQIISGTVAPTTSGATYTFKPDVPLLPFTKYTGTITLAAADKFKTAMVADYVWSFTTIPVFTVSANPTAGGTVSGGGAFAQGSSVTASAVPKTGYTFTNWTDSGSATVVSASPNYQFAMAGNRALVANFTLIPPAQFAVATSSNPAAGGSTFGSGSYNTGTTVTVIESPSPGYTFVNWTESGNVVSTSSSYQFVITANRTLVANFTIIPALQYALILSSNPQGGGTTSGAGTYTAGTSVTASATAATGYSFVNWTESGNIVSTSASYTFPLNNHRTLVANFAINTYTLAVTANPAAGGTVAKSPDQTTYNYGTNVQLTATANAGYIFTSWSVDATGSNNPLNVTMTANKSITANFTLIATPVVVNLGVAATFGAFGGNAGITNQGINTVINNGSIGTTAASTLITGFHDMTGDKYTETPLNIGDVKGRIYTAAPPPVIFAPGGPYGGNAQTKAIADQGLADANAAYLSISPAQKPGGTDPGAGELGGLTLPPGVYKSTGATFKITNLDLTLDAKGDPNAVWIFQTAAGLTVGTAAVARNVNLIGGAQAKNVFWYVGSAAVINYSGGGVMSGTVIAKDGITVSNPGASVVGPQAIINGRVISLVASVTMVNTTINVQ
jgi:uncharacterized repeat protein (TIGR02543 family)